MLSGGLLNSCKPPVCFSIFGICFVEMEMEIENALFLKRNEATGNQKTSLKNINTFTPKRSP